MMQGVLWVLIIWLAAPFSRGVEMPQPADSLPTNPGVTRWHMLNVSPREEQADCHLIEFPDGTKVLIDVADAGDAPGSALAALKSLNVTSIDLVLISHFHLDHYGRLSDLVNAGITVKRVAVNVPDEVCTVREQPWGCNLDHVRATLDGLRAKGISVFTPIAGETLVECTVDGKTVAKLEVICLYRGLDSPIGPTDVNDTSIIVRLSHGPSRALFTGDLNGALGSWLATSDFDLRADILKAPHHGTEGCAPNEFFDRVQASSVMVPGPKQLWLSGRSMRIRNYFADKKIPTYVNGLHGNVAVTFDHRGYSIETER